MGLRLVMFALIAYVMGVPAQAAAQSGNAPGGQASFVSGGVGEESLERMRKMSHGFNFKLLLALKSGNYIEGAAVRITDAKGTVVVDAVTEGPLLLARLAPGRYQVAATFGTQTLRAATTIAPAGRREVVFHFDRDDCKPPDCGIYPPAEPAAR